MRRFFAKKQDDYFEICDAEHKHLKNVLRFEEKEQIICFNGDGQEYVCQIESIQKNKTLAKIIKFSVCKGNATKNVALFLASCKREKLELILQKATELGATDIYIFPTKFSVAKLDDSKTTRLQEIAISACKQCERCDLPNIKILNKFDDVFDHLKQYNTKIFAYEREQSITKLQNLGDSIALIVGSEGGFCEEEKDKIIAFGCTSISLGKRILRCETASIVLMGLVQFSNYIN